VEFDLKRAEAKLASLKGRCDATATCLTERTDERYREALRADWLTRYFCAFGEVAIVSLLAGLAATSARRCDTCADDVGCESCIEDVAGGRRYVKFCSLWRAARAEEGSGDG